MHIYAYIHTNIYIYLYAFEYIYRVNPSHNSNEMYLCVGFRSLAGESGSESRREDSRKHEGEESEKLARIVL